MRLRDITEIVDLVNGQDLVTAGEGVTAAAAAQLMAQRAVGAVVLTTDGRPTGIFTERDLLVRVVAEGRDPGTTTLAEVMTPDPQVIDLDTEVTAAVDRMAVERFRHLPVVEELDGTPHLIGILSARDLLVILRKASAPRQTAAAGSV